MLDFNEAEFLLFIWSFRKSCFCIYFSCEILESRLRLMPEKGICGIQISYGYAIKLQNSPDLLV